MPGTHITKNFFAHGGEQLVIGGKLTFLDGAEVENFPGSTSGNAASGTVPYVADSEATTVVNLKNDFNALLAALRTTGVLLSEAPAAADPEPSDPESGEETSGGEG